MDTAAQRYADGSYLASNPGWHTADSPWKAQRVLEALDGWRPESVCEVGCGAGAILAELHRVLPGVPMVGYDIAEAAIAMAQHRVTDDLTFRQQDATHDPENFDLLLLMDVVEHVNDPLAFLAGLRTKAKRAIIHLPLDLSVQTVLRPAKLVDYRTRLGHLHYFTYETACATVRDAGYEIMDTRYTASFGLWTSSLKARLLSGPRRALPPAVASRLLGGYSVLISATPT